MKKEIQVNLKTYQRQWRINRNLIHDFLEKTWLALVKGRGARGEGRPVYIPAQVPAELTVVFLNDRQMQSYNKQYRNRDYPTDVLAFAVNERVEDRFYLGDILISMQTTAKQAGQKGHSVKTELQILLMHGILHLLGYDHEVDSGQMARLENRLRKRLF